MPGDERTDKGLGMFQAGMEKQHTTLTSGRWPANIIHDGSDEVVKGFPSPHGAGVARGGGLAVQDQDGGLYGLGQHKGNGARIGDTGSASRFFYCAKASRAERTAQGQVDNPHPTVKPLALMTYLCRLITPPGGIVLDPFMGSGSTGVAALAEGFKFTGIERDAESLAIAQQRICLGHEQTKHGQAQRWPQTAL